MEVSGGGREHHLPAPDCAGAEAVPGSCRAPDRASTAGGLGMGNRPVSFGRAARGGAPGGWALGPARVLGAGARKGQDGPRLQAWLRHTGHEHRVASCLSAHTGSVSHPAACGGDGKFTTCSLMWQPPPSPGHQETEPRTRSAEKPVPLLLLGRRAKAWSPRSAPTSWLKSTLGALQQRVPGLQRHQAQLRALEQLAQQLHRESLLSQLLGPEESQTFSTICGRPDTATVLAQGPISATLDAKPKPPATQIPSAERSE
nr:THAP domain-containing protein 8 [Meriones unguiculatus]